jgi:hypothetical protein
LDVLRKLIDVRQQTNFLSAESRNQVKKVRLTWSRNAVSGRLDAPPKSSAAARVVQQLADRDCR